MGKHAKPLETDEDRRRHTIAAITANALAAADGTKRRAGKHAGGLAALPYDRAQQRRLQRENASLNEWPQT